MSTGSKVVLGIIIMIIAGLLMFSGAFEIGLNA